MAAASRPCASAAAMAARRACGPERLRGLGAPQAGAVHRAGDQVVLAGALERVGDRRGGDRPVDALQAASTAAISAGDDQRSRGVVDQDPGRPAATRRRTPSRTDSARLSPAGRHAHVGQAGGAERRAHLVLPAGRREHHDLVDARSLARRASTLHSSMGRPASGDEGLGHLAAQAHPGAGGDDDRGGRRWAVIPPSWGRPVDRSGALRMMSSRRSPRREPSRRNLGMGLPGVEARLLSRRRCPRRRFLVALRGALSACEINATFYRLQSESTVTRWAAETPPGLPLRRQGASPADPRRGAPAGRGRPASSSSASWPHSPASATGSARCCCSSRPRAGRDDGVLGDLLACLPPGLPVALEFRHDSWDDPAVVDRIAAAGGTVCISETAGAVPERLPPGPDRPTCACGPSPYSHRGPRGLARPARARVGRAAGVRLRQARGRPGRRPPRRRGPRGVAGQPGLTARLSRAGPACG